MKTLSRCVFCARGLCAVILAGILTASAAGADPDRAKLTVAPLRSNLKAGMKQATWIRVGLEGPSADVTKQRAPVNLALVLDKSGSMQGEKIEQARRAAIDALALLSPADIVSVITYDTTVSVLVPATRITDRDAVAAAIRGIQASGNTALFAGVSKGAAEVRKFLDREHVNRIILLSDGLANVGPSAPGELGSLGLSLLKENITVSTLGLGLGYNEDLMVQLAGKSGGNHHFIEQATELADIFRREFDDVLSVVAQEVDLKIEIPAGIRPVRVLGNDADINGQQIVTRIAQIYSRQHRHLVIELEIPAGESGERRDLASVSATYTILKTAKTDQLAGTVNVEFSDSDQNVEASLNKSVMADVVALVSSDQNKLATKYLDEGRLDLCRQTLRENADYLKRNDDLLPGDSRLRVLSELNETQLRSLEGVDSKTDARANSTRKSFRALQNSVDQQQKLNVP